MNVTGDATCGRGRGSGGERAEGECGPGREPRCETAAGVRWEAVGGVLVRVASNPRGCFADFDWDGGARRPALIVFAVAGPCVALGHVAEAALLTGGVADAVSPLAFVVLAAVAPLGYVVTRSLLVHAVLGLRGRVRRPLVATFRGLAYAGVAVSPVFLLPLVGPAVYLAWTTILEVEAVRAAHGTSLREAIVALLVPIAALVAAVVARGLLVLVVGGA